MISQCAERRHQCGIRFTLCYIGQLIPGAYLDEESGDNGRRIRNDRDNSNVHTIDVHAHCPLQDA